MDIFAIINNRLESHIETAGRMAEVLVDIKQAVEIVVTTFRKGGKLLLAGNGGSAADAQHWAAEWMIRLSHHLDRPAMPAIALTTDSSVLTAGGNDIGFENIFSRQIEGLGQSGDIFIAITTSGRSENLLRAAETARKMGITVLGLLGDSGGPLKELCDHSVVIPSDDVQHIQEMHQFTGHILCEMSEKILYEES